MEFVTLILFLALYYVRPQEWFSRFNSLHPVQLLSVLALWAMIKSGKMKPRDLVRTPLDWLMVCYFIWTIICGFQPLVTLSEIASVVLFYFVAVRSLDSIPRQKRFLSWWCAFMLLIAALALASQYGFDPFGSYNVTEGPMKGRLMLNLTVFDNPNGLAHSIVPAVPLVYYLIFWRRRVMKAGLILLAIPLYCIFLTKSKGAFLCGFATVLATLTFGRSKMTQVIILILASTLGYGALYQLPRMTELSRAQSDPAIQGRVAAFSYGLHCMRTNFFGIGLTNFQKSFHDKGPLERVLVAHVVSSNHVSTKKYVYISRHYTKAPHGAYNQNGAELGYIGLYLFIGILYCCIRTLLLVKSRDDDEERIRRALFATVVAYAVSCWMVDFCYRPTFFMFVAAISAFHRHLLKKEAEGHEAVPENPLLVQRPWLRRLPPLPPIKMPGLPGLPGLTSPLPVGAAACLPAENVAAAPQPVAPLPGAAGSGRVLGWHKPESSSFQDVLLKKFIWTRLGLMDFVVILMLTFAAILFWEHLIATM